MDERQHGARVGQLEQQARHLARRLAIAHACEHEGEEALPQAAAARLEVRGRHVRLRRVGMRVDGGRVVRRHATMASVMRRGLSLLVVLLAPAPPRAVSPPATVAPAPPLAVVARAALLLVLRGREERALLRGGEERRVAVQLDPRELRQPRRLARGELPQQHEGVSHQLGRRVGVPE